MPFLKLFSSPLLSRKIQPSHARFYAASITRGDVERRVFNILKGFSKVDEKKVNLNADFQKDLGLDSLDTVEVVMAIEEDFDISVPDKIADNLRTVKETIEFIAEKTHAE